MCVLAGLLLAGCGPFKRRPKLPQPVAPMPPTTAPPSTGTLNPPPNSLPEPKLPPLPERKTVPPVGMPAEEPQETVPEPEPERKTPVHRTPRTTPAEQPAAPAPVEQPAPAPAKPAEIPRLAPMVGGDQGRAYNQAIDASLGTADANLREARRRGNLNPQQRNLLEQAETFARQAREMRATDVVAAKSLADRAAQLSRELVSSQR